MINNIDQNDDNDDINGKSNQKEKMIPYSYHNSNVKGNQMKPLFSEQNQHNHVTRSKTPKTNSRISANYNKPQIKVSANKPCVYPIDNCKSKRNKGIQRPMSNKQMKPLINNQRINVDKPKLQRPASANPKSIYKRHQDSSLNYQQQHQHQYKADQQSNKGKANNAVIPIKNDQMINNSKNKQKTRPLSSNPTINNIKPKIIPNSYNHNSNNKNNDSNYSSNIYNHYQHSFVQSKTTQKQIDPEHKILVNPIKIVEPLSSNIKSYQYKINYSLPNTQTQSTNQTITQNPNTNINSNAFLKRNIQVNIKNQSIPNFLMPSQLMANNYQA